MEDLSTKLSMLYMRLRNWIRTQPSAVFLLAIALISILWGIFGFSGNGGEAGNSTPFPIVMTGTDRSADLEATIKALSTANAPEVGTVLAPGAFETAVAGTLEVYMATASSEVLQSTPTETEMPTETATPTPSSTLFFYFTPTPSRSTPRPTTNPHPTSTFTPNSPTFTPKPTNTKENCAALPTSNPHYCPPSATP